MTVFEALIPTVSMVYWIWSAWLVKRRSRRGGELVETHGALQPVCFLRPLKSGIPDLALRLREFVRICVSKNDQLVIGVDDESEDLEIVKQLASEFPERVVQVVACRRELLQNPKVSKLAQMSVFANRDRWIILDSEFIAEPNWMQEFRREWETSRADAITAAYRFVGLQSIWESLDAASVLQTLWPGLAILEQQRKPAPVLGAVIGTSREDVEALGGWQWFGDYLADDNVLGTWLARKRRRVRFSPLVASLAMDRLDWRAYWNHQRRVALTYRVCNPVGFAGLIFTFGVTHALAVALLNATELVAWLLLAIVVLVRSATATSLAKSLRFRVPSLPVSSVLGSVVESVCWILAWFQRRVVWGNRVYRVTSDGRLY